MVLLGQFDIALEKKMISSEIHGGRTIDVGVFTAFVKERIDVEFQMKNANNKHMNKLKNCLQYLAGKC